MRRLAAVVVAMGLVGGRAGHAAVPAEGAEGAGASPLGGLTLEAGIMSALPGLLTVGHTLGGEIAIGHGSGVLGYGFATSLSTAEEDSLSWHETYLELRMRARVGIRVAAGSALWGLRFGAGVSVVHIGRTPHGTPGEDGEGLATSEWIGVPAFELEGGVTLGLTGDWGLSLFVGPTFHVGAVADRDNVWGWRGALGLVWAP